MAKPNQGYNAADDYNGVDAAIGDPYRSSSSVTLSDSTVLKPTRGLWVGTGGDVAVKLADDSASVTLKNVPSGALLWVRAIQVLSTGTTASNVVALY